MGIDDAAQQQGNLLPSLLLLNLVLLSCLPVLEAQSHPAMCTFDLYKCWHHDNSVLHISSYSYIYIYIGAVDSGMFDS